MKHSKQAQLRESAWHAQLSDLSDNLEYERRQRQRRRHKNLGPLDEDIANLSSGPEHFSMLSSLTSTAVPWKDRTIKIKNLAAAAFKSSRDALDWSAQQETPRLNVDDIEAAPESVEIDPQVCGKNKHINKRDRPRCNENNEP